MFVAIHLSPAAGNYVSAGTVALFDRLLFSRAEGHFLLAVDLYSSAIDSLKTLADESQESALAILLCAWNHFSCRRSC